ncbi:MAG: hypothetical protein HYZ53_08040 [Planctomycetes bacterium]|nr:hypothetical protein [Planctomycetota bacterium]
MVDRRRIELGDAANPDAVQVYHAAAGLPWSASRRLVEKATQAVNRRALEAVKAVLHELERDLRVVAGGVALGNATSLPPLDAILRSHLLLHAAEGELFRSAVVRACETAGLPVTGVPSRELSACGARALGVAPTELEAKLAALGRGLGPPWARDQRDAALVAWIGLTAAARQAGSNRGKGQGR